MDVFEAIEKRASVRAFKPGDVPDEHLIKIVDAGRRAPSGYNHQPWEFIVVTDAEILGRLGQIQECIAQAGAAIAVVVTETKYWKEDAAAAIENMLLAATALGYGSLWVEGYVLAQEPLAKKILGVPEEPHLIAIIPIGLPAKKPRQAVKRQIESIMFWNQYGQRRDQAD
ncbi:MAG: nitroreductase family protein [Phycisphaerae bacterium]|nr:nitroreductase family protein [Phycisphaerae bacterium]